MDVSRLTPGQIALGAGGALLIVSLFLDWISGETVQLGATTISSSGNAFDVFSGMDIIMFIIGLVALAYAGSAAMDTGASVPGQAPLVVAALGLIIFGWALGWDLENSQAGIGSWLALIASGAIAYGAYTANLPSSQPAASRQAPPPPPAEPAATASGPTSGSTPPPGP